MNILNALLASIKGEYREGMHTSAQLPYQHPLLDIPEDVLEKVFSNLCVRDLASCAQVCSSFQRLTQFTLAGKKEVNTDGAKRFHAGHSHLLIRWLASHCGPVEDISLTFLPLYSARQLGLLDAWLPFAQKCTNLTTLTLLNVHINDLCVRAVAESAPRLCQLVLGCEQGSVYGCLVGDRGIRAVAVKCPELQRLALLRCRVGDAGLRAFVTHSRSLTHFTLHLCEQVTRNGVITLAEGCRSLRSLDVLLCEVGVNAVTCLDFASMFVFAANCQQLQELYISEELTRNGVLDDACLSLLVDGCPKLHTLEFVQAELTDLSMMKLSVSCTNLRSLTLERTYVSDSGLKHVAKRCTMLQELRIVGRNEHVWSFPEESMLPGPTVAVLQELGQYSKHLTSLYCSGLGNSTHLSNGPLMHPDVCSRLKAFSLNWLKLEHAAFKPKLVELLSHCSSLTHLSLVGFHDNMLQILESLPRCSQRSLSSLDLSHTQADSTTTQYIARNMKGLQRLYLASCVSLSDEGLMRLQRMSTLEHLDLHNVPQITDDGVTSLARTCRSLTHLNVGHSPGIAHRLTLDGCKALYQISKAVNTHLHVELGPPLAPSEFQKRSLQRMRSLADQHRRQRQTAITPHSSSICV